MKIALVTSSFLPMIGGAEFVAHHLTMQWAMQGHEVCVFNDTTSDATLAQGKYTACRFNVMRGSFRLGYHRVPLAWFTIRDLQRCLDEFRPDFISAHFGYPVGWWLSRIKPLPRYLVTCHGRDVTKFDWGFRARYKCERQLAEALNKSAGAVAISTFARELMVELGVSPEKIQDIPNGVDTHKFKTGVDIDARKKLGVPEDGVMILSVGREHPQKAYDAGIKAFARVRLEAPNAYYVILGRNSSKWRGFADELGIDRDKLILCEGLYGDDLTAAYQQADIFFSPSRWEMFALVVLEAMAAGLPQVVTNVSGSQDAIKTNVNGIVVEPDEPEQMASALLQMIDEPQLRKRFGQVNLERARYYDWDNISRMYLKCLKKL